MIWGEWYHLQFRERLRKLRKENGLTQEQLAEKLNISRQSVAKWERGQSLPNITNLKEMSIIFNVTTDELLLK